MDERLTRLVSLVREAQPSLKFTILEIGAVPLEGKPEPFYQLLDECPGSRIIAFEVDEVSCEKLNRDARPGVTYFPKALGRREEVRPFYETRHPMCSSLYEPNEKLLGLYQGLDVAFLKAKSTIRTYSLDAFVEENSVGPVDFIKIDVQGAELEIFQGGASTLGSILATVCEVEFIPHYIDQPLFGDVCSYLTSQGLMFQKFLGLAGRSLRPVIINKDPFSASRHIWSDALFVKDVFSIPDLSDTGLLKLAVLSLIYDCPDLTHYCLMAYDGRNNSGLARAFMHGG